MIKFSDLKKKLKEKFSDLDTKFVRKVETWHKNRIMKKIAKGFQPGDDIRPIVDDNHEIRVHWSRIPTDLGKVLEIKPVNLHNKNGDIKFWYASKKEDSSGTTEYEIRSDKEIRDEIKRLNEQRRDSNNFGY